MVAFGQLASIQVLSLLCGSTRRAHGAKRSAQSVLREVRRFDRSIITVVFLASGYVGRNEAG
jgi:hypothetical protein